MADEFDMSEERLELLDEFLTESERHMVDLNDRFLHAKTAVKELKDMPENELDGMFRAAHTIKGTASFLDLKSVVGLTHELETILQRVKKQEMKLTEEIIDVLFEGLGDLQSLLDDLKDSGEEKTDITESVHKVQVILKGEGIPTAQAPKTEEKSEEKAAKLEIENKEAELTASEEPWDVNEKYLEAYLVDTEQNVESFNQALMTLEKDGKKVDTINEIFRAIHTIKGSSGIVSIKSVQDLAHSMENILAHVRERKESYPDMFTVLFKGIDYITKIINFLKVEKKLPNVDVQPLIQELADYFNRVKDKPVSSSAVEGKSDMLASLVKGVQSDDSKKQVLLDLIANNECPFQIVLTIEAYILMKSMKVVLMKERVKAVGMVILTIPDEGEIDDLSQKAVDLEILMCSFATIPEIQEALQIGGVNVKSVESIKEESVQACLDGKCEESKPEEVQEEVKKEKVQEEVLADTKEQVIAEAVNNEDVNISANKEAVETLISKKPKGKEEVLKAASIQATMIRIDTRKLDSLMNLSGELVTVRAQFERLVNLFNENTEDQKRFVQLVSDIKTNYDLLNKDMSPLLVGTDDNKNIRNAVKISNNITMSLAFLETEMNKDNFINQIHELDEITGSLGKISSDIQSGIMQTRMVPIEGAFTRFKRIVRDIAKSINKQVNLIIEGEDTELDKNLVDSLGDPLTHMIRNAMDHGIEKSAERNRLGKPEAGSIFLRALHRGNNIYIEVGDDGRGLDPEKLTQHALNKKIITEEQAEQLTYKERLHLLFLPGFSTAAKVTGLSGRGVGMDVVKNMITAVNGMIDIETELGQGTKFILKIPLTLAIIQALLVRVGNGIYAIPIEAVTEIVKVSIDEIYSIDGNDTIKLRDHVLSLVELHKVIGIAEQNKSTDKSKRIVVINDGESQLGVAVDSLVGESEIVIKALSNHFTYVKGISGATILGDGQIALILDPSTIIFESKERN